MMVIAKVPRASVESENTQPFTKFETGAVRDTGGKGRMDLIPMCALIRVSKHMEDALTHYPERNWEKGLPMHSMLDSAMRHLVKYMDGMNDEDHLCAAATNLLMAMWTEEKMPKMQDIPTRLVYNNEDASPYARRASLLASAGEDGTPVFPECAVQGTPQEAHEKEDDLAGCGWE